MKLALFVCRPIQGARMTAAGCAARYRALQPGGARAGRLALMSPACVGCSVGAAHAAGRQAERWDDGSPVEAAELAQQPPAPRAVKRREEPPRRGAVAAPPVAPTAAPRTPRRPEPSASPATPAVRPTKPAAPKGAASAPNPHVRHLTHDGITDTISGWARRIGITSVAIRLRLARHGDDLAQVLRPKDTAAQRAARRRVPAVPVVVEAPPSLRSLADVRALLTSTGWVVEDLGPGRAGGQMLIIRRAEVAA